MKKSLLLLFLIFNCSLFAQMPTNGDYSKWNWENTSSENWKRLKNGSWLTITPAFGSQGDKMNLIYEINQQKDYTKQKGWRLVHANFDGTFPYFVLCNDNSGVLRGFIYVDGDAAIPFGNSIMMSLTPDENLKSTKIFHLSEDLQYAVNDKSDAAKFSQNSVIAVTTGGLNSWVALEIPLLFDNTIEAINTNWTLEFFSGSNSNISLNIQGTSVPMDASGNNLFAHPKPGNNLNLKGEYAKIHTNIKNISAWGDKLKKNADELTIEKNSPKFLSTYKDLVGKLGNTIKISGAITQISSGIEVAMGIFDFFLGGSSNKQLIGYSHNFTGTGQITSLKYLRGNTMSVPGSKNANLPSWSYNVPPGVINLTTSPVIKKTSGYFDYSTLESEPSYIGGNYFKKTRDKAGNEKIYIYVRKSDRDIWGKPKFSEYPFSFIKAINDSRLLSQYKLNSNISIDVKGNINILESKFSLLSKSDKESIITTKSDIFSGNYVVPNTMFPKKTETIIVSNPIYEGLEKEEYQLYDFDRTTKSFIYGTPYMSIENLRKVNFKAYYNSNIYLGVIVKYTVSGDTEPRYFKGTYKVNLAEEKLPQLTYLGKEIVKSPFLETFFPARVVLNNYIYFNTLRSAISSDELESTHVVVSIYPNPSNGILNIQIPDSDNNLIEIFNLSGKLIYSKSTVNDSEIVDLTSEPKGVYLVRIISKGKEIKTERIVLK